jgi:hypothetical protein
MKIALTMLCLCVFAGCEAKPAKLAPFYDSQIKTLAVMPFEHKPAKTGPWTDASDFLTFSGSFEYDRPGLPFARRLATKLQASGVYKVTDPEEIANLHINLRPSSPTATSPPDALILAALRKHGGVDGYVTGVVRRQRVVQSTKVDYHDNLPLDSNTDDPNFGSSGQMMPPSPTIYYISQAQFEVIFTIHRAGDGKVLYESAKPVEGKIKLVKYQPTPPRELLDMAIDSVVSQIVAAITPPAGPTSAPSDKKN